MDIHVRQARFSDVESLAQLLVLSPDDGSKYRYPHIRNYPDEMHALHCRWLYPTIRDPQVLIRVAIIQANGEDVVVGFSSWINYETSSDSTDKTQPATMADWLPLVPETHDSPGTPASSRPSNALVTDKKRSEAFNKARARGELNHSHDVSPIGWNGLAIHPHYQGRGVATLVVRWGISKAIKKGVPVFVTGEFAGVEFYKKIGFRALEGTEFWLVKDGRELSSNQVNQGTTTWSAAEGGVSGAQLIWEPHQPIP